MNHLDLLISEIVQLITSITHKIYMQKVKAHDNIQGNEIVDSPTKKGSTLPIVSLVPIIHKTHSTQHPLLVAFHAHLYKT